MYQWGGASSIILCRAGWHFREEQSKGTCVPPWDTLSFSAALCPKRPPSSPWGTTATVVNEASGWSFMVPSRCLTFLLIQRRESGACTCQFSITRLMSIPGRKAPNEHQRSHQTASKAHLTEEMQGPPTPAETIRGVPKSSGKHIEFSSGLSCELSASLGFDFLFSKVEIWKVHVIPTHGIAVEIKGDLWRLLVHCEAWRW